jgi:hypothetical protein
MSRKEVGKRKRRSGMRESVLGLRGTLIASCSSDASPSAQRALSEALLAVLDELECAPSNMAYTALNLLGCELVCASLLRAAVDSGVQLSYLALELLGLIMFHTPVHFSHSHRQDHATDTIMCSSVHSFMRGNTQRGVRILKGILRVISRPAAADLFSGEHQAEHSMMVAAAGAAVELVCLLAKDPQVAQMLIKHTDVMWILLSLRSASTQRQRDEDGVSSSAGSSAGKHQRLQAGADGRILEGKSNGEHEMLSVSANLALERIFAAGQAACSPPWSVQTPATPSPHGQFDELVRAWQEREWLTSIRVLFAAELSRPSSWQSDGTCSNGRTRDKQEVSSMLPCLSSWTVGGHMAQLSCIAVLERDNVRRLVLDRWCPAAPMYVHSEARVTAAGAGAGGVITGGAWREVEVDTCNIMAWYARVVLTLIPFLPRSMGQDSGNIPRSASQTTADVDILVLGLGGGVIPTYLIRHLPNCNVHVVELLQDLVPVARR